MAATASSWPIEAGARADDARLPQRRFPPPWRADKHPGRLCRRDANGQALAYMYSRENEAEARQAMLTKSEAGASPSIAGNQRACLYFTPTQ